MMLYISAMDHARKIQQLCSSDVYKQNVSILLRMSDSLLERLLFSSMGAIISVWNMLGW